MRSTNNNFTLSLRTADKEPFVHLCGSRYVDRHEDTTEIKVYSNQSTVTLYMDGVEVGVVEADKIFKWSVKITGEHTFTAKSGNLSDTMTIRKVAEPNMSYCKNPEAVVNWFDKEEISRPEGYFSIYDTMGEVQANPAAAAVLAPIQEKAVAAYGDVARNIKVPESMLKARHIKSAT